MSWQYEITKPSIRCKIKSLIAKDQRVENWQTPFTVKKQKVAIKK